MIVMIDELFDVGFEIARQVVVFQQDAVLERLMPAFDLALCLRMDRSAANAERRASRALPRSFALTGASLMASPDNVVVIGAGIGGLTAALALLKQDIDVDIYEQAPELKEGGAGIQTSSNGTRVLYALGLEQALTRLQVVPSRRELRHWKTGESWNWFDLGAASVTRYGTPHIMMHRGDLQGVLTEAVRRLKAGAIH